MRQRTEPTQEYLDWQLLALFVMDERRGRIAAELASFPSHQGLPEAKTLADAFARRSLIADLAEADAEAKALAGDMLEAGIPEQVWFVAEREGEPVRVKLYTSNDRPFYKIEKAG